MRRVAVVGLLVLFAAACGGDSGPTLEEWAEQADGVCDDARDESDELEIETIEDIADRGDDAVEIAEEAVEELRALEAPGGEDEQVATDLIQAFEAYIAVQEEILDEVGDDGRDEIALTAIALENIEAVEDGIDAANEARAVECRETFDRRLATIEGAQSVFEGSEDYVDLRVGDCLTAIGDDDGDPEGIDCDDDDAEAEITASSLTGGDCRDDEQSIGVGSGITYCLERIGASASEEDGFLRIGSCIILEDAPGDQVDVTEVACFDDAGTHEIVDSVAEDASCADGHRQFAKTDDEIDDSGPGEWCAEPV